MLLELLLAGILVNKSIDSVDKNFKHRIEKCQNRITILQEKINNDLLLYENQKLKEELEQLKNSKESL